MITLSSFLYDTAITLLFMTLFIGGMGILGIRRAVKEKIIFSKEELFKKEEDYTPLQMFLTSFLFLGVSLWYNFYKGNMFEYIEKAQILFRKSEIDFEIMAIVPILAVFIVFLFFAGIYFQKSYATKNNNMYLIEYTLADKISGTLLAIIIYALISFVNSKGINYQTILLSSFFILVIILLTLKVIFLKILFNNEYIEFHTFWRPKRTIFWKDIKKMEYEDKNQQIILIRTNDNKKFRISTRVNGLASFMSTFKIRNKK